MNQWTVAVISSAPLLRAGAASLLAEGSSVVVPPRSADVLVLVEPLCEREHLEQLRVWRPKGCVLVTDHLDEQDLPLAADCGVSQILGRWAVSPAKLTEVVYQAAQGRARASSRVLAELSGQLTVVITATNGEIAARERELLRWLAEGLNYDQIAERLGCSVRTTKSMLGRLLRRLPVRNRTQAVAYAIRQGAI
ncbi:LuxR C-terminal-related transcriptional regulator [Kutzneria viridogrisea]|uniref:HTH luxR-type domain-containing protein n=2 Tax=Kutzneria TaxID=43356 RepID=W5WBU7_9PSEU|nr:LuxR C-terminal-related transcriptional regulator [Kutzneria albida]AHH98372.1 hypothetical protein KALB_5010 [Kutzneria albida DSM 43870]MBA8924108.1 DNA-binding NarL/FixJ family response regulator [Kutzneria viridogrisea]